MDFVKKIKNEVKKNRKTIVLPEGDEPRILQAARMLKDEELISSVILIGNTEKIRKVAESEGVSLDNIIIEETANKNYFDEYTNEYYELRKNKGMTTSEARQVMESPIYWGAMMVRKGRADTMVAGSATPTAKVLRASLHIIKTAAGKKVASSCIVVCHPEKKWGDNGRFIFSDCAIIPQPDSHQLFEITLSAAESCRKYLDVEPVVALLSYSTKGSASHPQVDKVRETLSLLKQKEPNLIVDGEMQVDAALVKEVADFKAPDSPVGGKANVLIFPDLAAGNIGYKLVQRLSGAKAYGPILQGFSYPVSDLSRGCTVEDIVMVCALTML